jgi:alanyl-tRNA synthetase
MLTKELDDEYLRAVEKHLRQLAFRSGVLISAELGKGNKGTGYLLRKPPNTRRGWMERLLISVS